MDTYGFFAFCRQNNTGEQYPEHSIKIFWLPDYHWIFNQKKNNVQSDIFPIWLLYILMSIS